MADVRLLKIGSGGGFAQTSDSDLGQLGGLNMGEAGTVPGGSPSAGRGKLWVRSDAPNTLMFTDDGGTDFAVAGAAAGGGGVDTNGTPVAGQVASFFDADTIEGSADLTFTGGGSAPILQVGASTDKTVLAFGNMTPAANLSAGQNIIQMGANNAADYSTVDVSGAFFSAGLDGNLTSTNFYLGTGASSRIWANFPTTFRWHFGDTDHTYDWGGLSATWQDPSTGRASWFWGVQNGTFTIQAQSGNQRRFIVDTNQDLTDPNNTTNFSVEGRRDSASLDEWTISVTGDNFLSTTEMRLEAPGRLIFQPGGTNNLAQNVGAVFRPNFNMSQSGGGALVTLNGRTSDNRLFSLSGGDSGDYAVLLIDVDFFADNAAQQIHGIKLQMDEDAASANLPFFLHFSGIPFGGSLTTFFTVDYDGNLFARGDLALGGDTAFTGTFTSTPTAARTWTMPDQDGTVLLSGQAPDISGTPSGNQVARWTDADTLTGDSELTYTSGSEDVLVVGGQTVGSGTNVVRAGNTAPFVFQGFTPSAGNVDGGAAKITAGAPAGTGDGGDTTVSASSAIVSNGARGGDVLIGPGSGDGAGRDGKVRFSTSSLKTTGIDIEFVHGSTSAADNDEITVFKFIGFDDNVSPNETEYGRMTVEIADVTDTTEDGRMFFSVLANASTVEALRLDPTEVSVNNPGNDRDFRVAGASLSHLVFAEGNAASENVALVAGSAPTWNSLDRGLFIGGVTTEPTGNPTGGCYMWFNTSDNKLKVRLPSGDIIEVAGPV